MKAEERRKEIVNLMLAEKRQSRVGSCLNISEYQDKLLFRIYLY